MNGLPLFQKAVLIAVALAAPLVVLSRDPRKQVVSVSFYGLLFALLFFLYQAPDVALSQVAVGAVALPLMILLSMAKIRRDADRQRNAK